MPKNSTKKGTTKKTTTKKSVNKTITKKENIKKTTPKKEAVNKTTAKKENIKKSVPKKEVVKKEIVKEVEVKEPQIVEVKKDDVKETKKTILTKKNIIVFVIIIVLIIIAVGTSLIYDNPKNIITRSMKNMGEDFYTNYFYDNLKEGRSDKELSDVLSRYKDTGIKINIRNLSQYDSGKYKKEIDSFKGKNKECSKNNTKVIIYPKSPYKKSDYKIKIELDCGF